MLEKSAADMARRETIRKAVAEDEQAAALEQLNNRSGQEREARALQRAEREARERTAR